MIIGLKSYIPYTVHNNAYELTIIIYQCDCALRHTTIQSNTCYNPYIIYTIGVYIQYYNHFSAAKQTSLQTHLNVPLKLHRNFVLFSCSVPICYCVNKIAFKAICTKTPKQKQTKKPICRIVNPALPLLRFVHRLPHACDFYTQNEIVQNHCIKQFSSPSTKYLNI